MSKDKITKASSLTDNENQAKVVSEVEIDKNQNGTSVNLNESHIVEGASVNGKERKNGKKDKTYSTKATWLKLASFSKEYMPALIVALVLTALSVVIDVIAPSYLSDLTNEVQKGLMGSMDMPAVLKIAITLTIMYITVLTVWFIADLILGILTQKVAKKMRKEINIKINKLPLKYFDSHSIGDTLSRVTNDVDTIGQTLNQSINNLIASVLMVIGSAIMMFVTNWILALVAIGASIIGFAIMGIVMKSSQKYFTKQQIVLGKLNGHIEESYAGHNVVKAYNAQEKRGKDFDGYNGELYECGWKSQFFSGLMMPIMSFIGNFGYVAVCVVGAILAFNGTIGFGVIIAFIVYVRLFSSPLSQIAQCMTQMQQATAGSFRVFEFLEEKEFEKDKEHTIKVENVAGNIDFENVKFGYNEEKTIINDFSINIKSGQKVAIVGPTGAGKTTMVNLLMRFYEVGGGHIKVDGIDIADMKRSDVHKMFSMVLQDTWLFEGTIMENIRFNNDSVSDEDVVNACVNVGLDHYIMSLSKGYDTVLNEEANISQGQKQLITIARAMVQNAPMLILDEATSSVDTRTEILIQNAMDKLMKGKTSIIIAHRLSTIKNADLILVMKNGDIIEKGTHKQLLAQKGFYADLYNSQFDENNED